MIADGIFSTVSATDTAAGPPDLPQHGGQGGGHPVILLTMFLAGQRPAYRDHRSVSSHASRQVTDISRIQSCNGCGPFGLFGLSVRFPHEVG